MANCAVCSCLPGSLENCGNNYGNLESLRSRKQHQDNGNYGKRWQIMENWGRSRGQAGGQS